MLGAIARFLTSALFLGLVAASVIVAGIYAYRANQKGALEAARVDGEHFPIPELPEAKPKPASKPTHYPGASKRNPDGSWPKRDHHWDDAVAAAKDAVEDGDYDTAIALNTKAIDSHLDPDLDFLLLIRRGDCYLEKKQPDKALADYDKAAQLLGPNAHLELEHALAWLQKGDEDKASAAFAAALAKDPADGGIYAARAKEFVNEGALDRAIPDYRKALELDPRNTESRLGLAEVYLRKGDYPKAVREATIALHINPGAYQTYAIRALVYSKFGMIDRALAELDAEANDTRVDIGAALNQVAWIRATNPNQALRDGKKAIAEATRACELRRWKYWYLYTLAAAYAEAGDFDSAIKFQKQGIEKAASKHRNTDDQNARLRLYEQHRALREESDQ